MGSVSRVFVAQLVGLPVFGPDGESIGKIRDVVASLRTDRQPPRVLGAVVELATRRRIFVPMLRVTSIDANAVTLATGSVNLRRFHQRPNEVLVVGQLLDARVLIASNEAIAVVVDAAMEPTRTRDWVLGRVAIQQRTGRLGRRGPVQVLRWEEIRGPGGITDLSAVPQGTDKLLAVFDTMRAADVAAALRELPTKRRYEVAD
ncbi:MAG TPA: PRC-barrel domain-containing protein, partial [Actinophytocola sp.]|nr:PRC-barrel domain-containing protein [Actinophytocola sp.]